MVAGQLPVARQRLVVPQQVDHAQVAIHHVPPPS
jgi:hypothetical protein